MVTFLFSIVRNITVRVRTNNDPANRKEKESEQ